MSIFSFIGGGLGFAFGGYIGGLIGFTLGGAIDQMVGGNQQLPPNTGRRTRARRPRATQGDIHVSLIVLLAAVMKADGKLQKSELNVVKKIFKEQFGAAQSQEMLTLLRDVLKKDIDVRQACIQIRQYTSHPVRMQLIHYAVQVAMADGRLHPGEKQVVERAAMYLGVSDKDLGRISSMFGKKVDERSSYQILGIEPNASDAEVKKAYRKLVKKYHPDRVLSESPDFQKAAEEKFRKIQEAYDAICKARGI